MSTPFKMKGFSGFGNSPLKQKVRKDTIQHATKVMNVFKRKIGKKVSYSDAWTGMTPEEQGKYTDEAAFTEAAKEWNIQNPDVDKTSFDKGTFR